MDNRDGTFIRIRIHMFADMRIIRMNRKFRMYAWPTLVVIVMRRLLMLSSLGLLFLWPKRQLLGGTRGNPEDSSLQIRPRISDNHNKDIEEASAYMIYMESQKWFTDKKIGRG